MKTTGGGEVLLKLVAAMVIAVLLVAIWLGMNQLAYSNVRGLLLERYGSVQSIRKDHFQLRCNAGGKGREKYDFVATRANGSEVRGYICYTGILDIYGPQIHETQ